MLVGYMRVSTTDDRQTVDLQRDALVATGVDHRHLHTDKASGARDDRPGLKACLDYLNAGDTLIVWKLDRLGRSLPHLLTIVTDLKARGIAFRSLTEQMDTTTPHGELLFSLFGALAQYERALTRERVMAGLAAAKRRGRQGGRPPMIDAETLERITAALDGGLEELNRDQRMDEVPRQVAQGLLGGLGHEVGRPPAGGGWPESCLDVASAVDALAELHRTHPHLPRLDLGRVVALGRQGRAVHAQAQGQLGARYLPPASGRRRMAAIAIGQTGRAAAAAEQQQARLVYFELQGGGTGLSTIGKRGRAPAGAQRQVIARFDRARALVDAGVGLAEASLRAGYADQAHFTHDFRTVTGVTPGEYRADQPSDGEASKAEAGESGAAG